MLKLYLIVCILCLLSPCTAYLSSAAQPIIQLAPLIIAKAEATATLVTTTTIFQYMSAAALAHPFIAGAALGASVSAAAVAYSTISRGTSYSYNELASSFRQKIQTAKRITQIGIYSSPVQNSPLPHKINLPWVKEIDLSHHQIIFQVDHLLWLLISFGMDGLQVGAALQRQALVQRRKNNTIITHKKVDIPTQKVSDLLKQYEGYKYDMLMWNCQGFVQHVQDALFK